MVTTVLDSLKLAPGDRPAAAANQPLAAHADTAASAASPASTAAVAAQGRVFTTYIGPGFDT